MLLKTILSRVFEEAVAQLGLRLEKAISDIALAEALNAFREMNFSSAYESFEFAAKINPIAHYHIGCMRYHGLGTVKNVGMAVEHFIIAATCIPQALHSLGIICKNGAIGFPVDKTQALAFFYIAATEDREFAVIEQTNLEAEMDDKDILFAQAEAKKWEEQFPNWNMWLLNVT